MPEGQGQEPEQFLPKSVLQAVEGLGLDEPRLVSQTVNSLSRDDDPHREVSFTSRVPAVVFATPSEYASSGRIWPVRDGRVEVEVELSVTTAGVPIANLSGSLATPLGHFMVLGTANLVSPEIGASRNGRDGDGGGLWRAGDSTADVAVNSG